MTKHPQFNSFIEGIRKDKEIKELNKQIRDKDYKIRNLEIRADAKSLIQRST